MKNVFVDEQVPERPWRGVYIFAKGRSPMLANNCGLSHSLISLRPRAAIDDAGDIVASTCGGMLVLVPAGPPAAPSELSFTVSERVVALSWQQIGRCIRVSGGAGSAPGLADLYLASVGAQLSLTTPAPPGRYYVRVRARSAGGLSTPSNEVVIDVP